MLINFTILGIVFARQNFTNILPKKKYSFMNRSSTGFRYRYLTFFMLAFGTFACQTINKKVKYYSTEITLKNGTVLKGSTSPITDDSFTFKDAQTSKKSTIISKDVLSITKQTPEGVKEYAQFEIENKKKRNKTETVLAAYEVKGEVNLIAYESKQHVRKAKDINNRMTFVEETALLKRQYVKRQNEAGVEVPIAKHKTQEEEFTDLALNYFADAPVLMKKIGTPGYEATDIKKIVEEYNRLKARR